MVSARRSNINPDLARRDDIKGGSDRSFGIVFAAVFLIIGLWPLTGGGGVRIWSLAIAALFLVLALAYPRSLASLNRAWTAFGILLSRIVNPIIMALVFYLVVTPTGLIFRLRGKDPLRLKLDPLARTYWIDRDPPGPDPDSMPRQF